MIVMIQAVTDPTHVAGAQEGELLLTIVRSARTLEWKMVITSLKSMLTRMMLLYTDSPSLINDDATGSKKSEVQSPSGVKKSVHGTDEYLKEKIESDSGVCDSQEDSILSGSDGLESGKCIICNSLGEC